MVKYGTLLKQKKRQIQCTISLKTKIKKRYTGSICFRGTTFDFKLIQFFKTIELIKRFRLIKREFIKLSNDIYGFIYVSGIVLYL